MARTLFAVCAAAVTVAAFGVASATANSKPTTGQRLGIAATTFAANTPFYIENGFACDLGDGVCLAPQIGGGEFDLYVDGVLAASTVDVDKADGSVSKLFLSNFGGGLPAGDHSFYRVWLQSGVVVQTVTQTVSFS